MLQDILKAERADAASKLIGICAAYTASLDAARALQAGDPVALIPDPTLTQTALKAVTVDVEVFLIYPSLDEEEARTHFGEAFIALWPWDRATPQMVDIGEDQYFAYRVTYSNTYKI